MKFNPGIHKRRSIRLKGYDYSQAGLYFMTICVQNKECLFGKVENDAMVLNKAGRMIAKEWLAIPNRFPTIELHDYILMPNHFHAILEIIDLTDIGNQIINTNPIQKSDQLPMPNNHKTIGDMIDAFKSITTVNYIRGVKNLNWQPFDGRLWQRNYYEHIIRNQTSYDNIADYIITNPAKWQDDQLYKQ